MAIGLAFRAFFKVLFDSDAASRVGVALAGHMLPAPEVPAPEKPAPKKSEQPATVAKPTRSEALTLLSTLQREGRFLDLVGESLDGFDDAQVGAAARQVISDVRKSLDRMFAIAPLESAEEGSTLDIPRPASPVRYHFVGRNTEQAAKGTVVHRGWKADRCQMPTWNGSREDAFVLSPIEIEVDG